MQRVVEDHLSAATVAAQSRLWRCSGVQDGRHPSAAKQEAKEGFTSGGVVREYAREGRVCVEEVGVSAAWEVCNGTVDFKTKTGAAIVPRYSRSERWTVSACALRRGCFMHNSPFGNVPIDRFKRLGETMK